MKHFTKSELVDLVEGALAPDRRLHLDGCDSCRAQAAELRQAFERLSTADVPEPSPLFWDHFSARVRGAVAEATPDEPRGWFSWARTTSLPWAAAGAVATAVLVVTVWRASAPEAPRLNPPAAQPTIAAVNATDPDTLDPDADEAWALVRTVADDVVWDPDDGGASLGVRPGSAERAIAELTQAERSELVRLLEAEIRM
jgi:hypothetical protein